MHRFFRQKNIVSILVKALCILLFAVFAVRAERLPIKVYTSDDGLGSSASFNLVRDPRGFIWLCSRDGLVRFDGYRFITYRVGDDDADPAVFDLIPTRRGAYWIDLNRGTDYRFMPSIDELPLHPLAQSAAKNDSRVQLQAEPVGDERLPKFEDSFGNLWNSDNKGIYLLRDAGGNLTSELIELNLPGLPKDKLNVTTFVQGENDAFWLGTNWGVVRRLPDGRMIHYLFDPKNGADAVRHLAEDKQGRVWMTRSDGLMILKIDSVFESVGEGFSSRRALVKNGVVNAEGQPQLPEQPGEAVFFSFDDVLRRKAKKEAAKSTDPTPEFYKIICSADGKIWIAGNHGIVVFDGKKIQHYTTEQGLATNVIAQIVEDYGGHIWLASYGGLHRLNPKGLTMYDEADGLERNRIHSIYEDRNGDLTVVSGNFNVSRLSADGTFKMARPQLPPKSVWVWSSNAAFLDSRGDWWINTNESVYRFTNVARAEDLHDKAPTEIYNESNGLLSGNNVRIFEDSNGDIWFCPWVTSERVGLSRWQRSTGQIQNFTTADGLPEKPIASAFAEDAAGNLWFGFTTGSNGLVRFRDGRFTIIDDPGILKAGISDIYRDSADRLWIATNGEGLFRVDAPAAEKPIFQRYRIADGLTSDNVRCVTEDLHGNIYVGTVRGVNRLSPATGRIKHYGTSDGLASDFINTAFRDSRGTIWFGTFNGLSKLTPEEDASLPAPSILISNLRIAGEDFSVSPLGQHEVFVPEQSSNRNNLQIDFLSINAGGNTVVRYQYQLEGADKNWSEPTTQNSVTFANLSSGSYRFLVRAVNADGVVSAQPAAVSFTILHPVWQRWWFIVLAAIATGATIYAIYRYRIEQVIKLERVRTRIATDLHDDIGSSLSKIAILSEVVRRKNGSGENGLSANYKNEPLEIIANTSREMVDSMSDIVWAINPERDNLSDLIHRMRRFAEDILDAQDVSYQFIVPEHLRETALGADVRRDVYLIFKECINNLAKYARASEAIINIKLESNFLFVEIADDGRGFDVESVLNGDSSKNLGGNGLKNIKRRAGNFGGSIEIESTIGAGTRIVLRIPVERKFFAV